MENCKFLMMCLLLFRCLLFLFPFRSSIFPYPSSVFSSSSVMFSFSFNLILIPLNSHASSLFSFYNALSFSLVHFLRIYTLRPSLSPAPISLLSFLISSCSLIQAHFNSNWIGHILLRYHTSLHHAHFDVTVLYHFISPSGRKCPSRRDMILSIVQIHGDCID